MKILIIRFSSIGDIVLTTPVIRALKTQLNAEIHYLTKPAFSPILSNNPYIDQLILLPTEENKLRPILRKEKYDVIIDLHHNLRSFRFSFGLAPRIYRFPKLNIQKWLIVNLKVNLLPDKHIVERYLSTVAPLGVTADSEGLEYFHNEDINSVKMRFQLPEKYWVYAIGGQHQTKKMPAEKMFELISKLKGPGILIGGKEDTETGEYLCERSQGVLQLCGKTGLNESAAIISAADCVITHDSGMMHIAAAYRKKIISIWGNTIPEFGMYPYKADEHSRIFQVPQLSCRPCSKIGHNTCPKGHFKCMQLQDTESMSGFING